MGMILNEGAFFMAWPEEIVEACREATEGIEALLDKLLGFGTPSPMEELAALAVPGYCPTPREIERAGWQNAAALARSRMAARAQAFARQMMQQKARQAMKRRKLMHSESSFPDLRVCATCKHRRPMGVTKPPPCTGCIKGGECTRWEDAGGEDDGE